MMTPQISCSHALDVHFPVFHLLPDLGPCPGFLLHLQKTACFQGGYPVLEARPFRGFFGAIFLMSFTLKVDHLVEST